jgi:hypothetical protein
MSGKITRTTKSVEQKLRREIADLQRRIDQIPLRRQLRSPEFAALTAAWNQLHPNDTVTPKTYLNRFRLNREDSTLASDYGRVPFEPADDVFEEEVGPEDLELISRGGYLFGAIAESPEDAGVRFNAPQWVRDIKMFREFGRALLRVRLAKHPTLAEFEKSRSELDCLVLWSYFVDRASYTELYEKYRRPASEFWEVRAEDADSIQGALEFAAEKNGTIALFSKEEGHSVRDSITGKWHKAMVRNLGKTFRVEVHLAVEDKFYLPEKLDPSKTIRPLQQYVANLVEEGYELLKIAKPANADREVARQKREAENDSVISRAQYGVKGASSDVNAHRTVKDPVNPVREAYGQLVAAENEIKKAIEDEQRQTATQGMTPAEVKLFDWRHGNLVYAEFLASINPNDPKRVEAVARAKAKLVAMSHPQAPVVMTLTKAEPVASPAARPKPEAPAVPTVSHEILRLSLVCFLAGLVQGRQSNPPRQSRLPARGGMNPA